MIIIVNNSDCTIAFRPLKPKIAVPSQIQLILASSLRSFEICNYFRVNLTYVNTFKRHYTFRLSYSFNLVDGLSTFNKSVPL